jgi:hypothetical protein
LASACVGLIPTVVQAEQTITAVDLAGPAMVLASIALVSAWPNGRYRWALLILSGLACGFAVGCKVSFGICAVIVAIFVFREIEGRTSRRAMAVLVFLSAALLAGGFSYLRNTILTGNPFYPAEIGPFAGPFPKDLQFRTSLLGVIVQSGFDSRFVMRVILDYARWPFGVAALCLVGYGMTAWMLLRRESGSASCRRLVLLLWVLGAMCILQFPSMPFSGTANRVDCPYIVLKRYLVLPVSIGLILLTPAWRGPAGRRVIGFLFVCAFLGLCVFNRSRMVWLLAGGLAGYAVAWLSSMDSVTLRSSKARVLIGVAATTCLVTITPYRQREVDLSVLDSARLFEYPTQAAWTWVDGLPAGTRICQFGSGAWQYYHLFGRRYQLTPMVLSPDGSSSFPLHAHAPFEWWGKETPVERLAFISNLQAQALGCVVVSRVADHDWPPQSALLDDSPEALLSFSNSCIRAYRLKGSGTPHHQ